MKNRESNQTSQTASFPQSNFINETVLHQMMKKNFLNKSYSYIYHIKILIIFRTFFE